MKYFILVFIVVLLVLNFSCRTKKTQSHIYYKFNQNKENINLVEFDEYYKLEIPNLKIKGILKYSYIDSSSQIKSYKLLRQKNILYEITYSTDGFVVFVDSFPVPKIAYKNPMDFGFINKDTIFYIYNGYYNANEEYLCDSSIVLADSKGKIKKIYKLEGSQIPALYNSNYIGSDLSQFFMYNELEPFCFRDNKLFIFFRVGGNFFGEYNQKKIPLAGYLDLKTEKFYSLDVHYPDIDYGNDFYNYSQMNYYATFTHDDELLFSFKYTPTLIKCNYKTGHVKEIRVKSSIIDTIYPAKNKKDVPALIFPMPYPENWVIYYDKYRHFYYRMTMIPPEKYGYRFLLTVLDTNFNYVAENLINFKGISFLSLKNYLLIGSKFYKLNIRQGSNTEIFSEIEKLDKDNTLINKPIAHYFNKYGNIKIKNNLITFLWYDNMCRGTASGIIDFYITNNAKFIEKGIYLNIITNNNKLIKYIKDLDVKSIIIDSSNVLKTYKNAPKPEMMPRIVIFKNKKISIDTVYQISAQEDFQEFQKYVIHKGKILLK